MGHSTSSGLDAANVSHRSPMLLPQPELPTSPTKIDPELQAQAWALFLDLTKDLNNFNSLSQQPCSATVGAVAPSIPTQRKYARNQKMESSSKAHPFDPESWRAKKGKSVQSEEGIHGGQPTTSSLQATSSPRNGSNATTSTHLRNHKLDTAFCEDGWDPAKMPRRKKQDSEVKTIQSSHRS